MADEIPQQPSLPKQSPEELAAIKAALDDRMKRLIATGFKPKPEEAPK